MAIYLLPSHISFGNAVSLAGAAGKLNAVNFDFHWNDRYNVWSGLIGGMFHVQGEKWGWQAKTAKQWLAKFQGTPEYELERKRLANALPAEDDDEEIN